MEPVVEIRGLTFTYSGSASPALEGVDLQVYPGEFLTITGPSGCGKTTLALCIAGFIPHAYAGKMKGVVRVQGRDTREYPAGGLSSIVGLVQQDPDAQLCTLTVSDEVAFGPENLCIPPEEIRERVYFALDAVDALDLMDRKVHTLSGGEKQRVAIASVLAMKPSIIILDEPTANLDPSCANEVLKALKRLKYEHGISVVIIEHRLERLIPISDRLLVMQKGKIVGEGTPKDFRKIYIPAERRVDSVTALKKGKLPGCKTKVEKPLLSVENLKAGYENKDVISGISFHAYPGETIAIMGDNGSGKTTLLLALLGILKPREGKIYLDGEDITREKASRRARVMGLTFQNPNHQIFENTVFKEAVLPSLFLSRDTLGEIEHRADCLLEAFELKQYKDATPFTLSLGEKKRLTLVSVLAYSPKVLILDEPLVGQDDYRLDVLMAVLREHSAHGGITLMVCHEPAVVASCCHRILFLSEGKLIIDAPVNEALAKLAQLGLEEYLPAGYEFSLPGEEGKKSEQSRITVRDRITSAVNGFSPEPTRDGNRTLLHRIHPLVKLFFLFSFSMTVFAVPFWRGEITLFCLLLGLYALAGQGLAFFSRRLRFIFVFGLLIFLVQILAVKEGILLWQFDLGSVRLSIWSEGLSRGLSMMLRFVNIIGSSYLFVATTDSNRLAYALMQAGLPYRFGFMLITALRFIPVFHMELEQVKNAQMAKGIEIEGISPGKLLRVVRYILVPLVISALSRVDSLTISMESRAFGLYPARSYMYSQNLSRNDKIAIFVIPVIFLLFYLIFRSLV